MSCAGLRRKKDNFLSFFSFFFFGIMCTEKLLTITLEMSANEVNTTSYDFLLTQAVFGLNLVQRKTQYPHQNMLITN